jgi:hypothetical protein
MIDLEHPGQVGDFDHVVGESSAGEGPGDRVPLVKRTQFPGLTPTGFRKRRRLGLKRSVAQHIDSGSRCLMENLPRLVMKHKTRMALNGNANLY